MSAAEFSSDGDAVEKFYKDGKLIATRPIPIEKRMEIFMNYLAIAEQKEHLGNLTLKVVTSPPFSPPNPRIVLLSSKGAQLPTSGYLVMERKMHQNYIPCLKMAISETASKKSTTHNVSYLKKEVHFQVGFLQKDEISKLQIKISARQTNRQDWLTQIWTKIDASIINAVPTKSDEGFIRHSSLEFDRDAISHLLMMLYSEFWERSKTPYSARQADLLIAEVDDITRGAFSEKYKRKGFTYDPL